MGFNTTITGPVQIRTRLSTGVAGLPAGVLQPREIFWNRADRKLYVCLDAVDGGGYATTADIIGGDGAFLLKALLNAANGIAPLDANKWVPIANIPPSLLGAMVYQGTWNPNTNSPLLVSGQGTKGYVYKVSVKAASVAAVAGAAFGTGVTAISVVSAAGITLGQLVTGAGIAANTTVASINGTTIGLSAATIGGVTNGQALTFTPYLDGISQLYPGDQVAFDGSTWDKIEGSPTEVYSVSGRTGDVILVATDISDSGSTGRALLATGTAQSARDALSIESYVALNDVNGNAPATASDVVMSAMTAARSVTLPRANTVTAGRCITIGDDSGQCSSANTLTSLPSGSDTINGGTSDVMTVAYSQTKYRSNGSNRWTIVRKVPAASTGGVDAGTV